MIELDYAFFKLWKIRILKYFFQMNYLIQKVVKFVNKTIRYLWLNKVYEFHLLEFII